MMNIDIKELKTHDQFLEVLDLQEKIWHLSDKDKISPITLRALAMEYPLMGISLGAYHQSTMVGFVICLPTREPNTIFGLIMGILPEYEGKYIGDKLNNKILEFCQRKGITKICWTFEPLEKNLAQFYIEKYGAIVVKYKEDYYYVEDEINKGLPIDRFIADCNPLSSRVTERIQKKARKELSMADIKKNYQIATSSYAPEKGPVLVEIPSNFQKLKKENPENALAYRLNTRKLFNEYINSKGYYISDFYSAIENGQKRYFYLLEKKSFITN